MADYKDHLERLVFEVYGADEAKRKLEEIAKAEDKYAKSTRGVIREAKNRAKAEEDAAKQIVESKRKIAEAATKASLAIAVAAAAAVQRFAEQEAALGRLERAFRNTNATSGEYSKAVDELRKRSALLGVSFEEQADGLAQLADASGSATKAQKDLSLAVDIAAAEGRDLRDAVELLRKARNGEVEELKNLNGINKEQAEALAKIEDGSLRASKAIDILTKSYTGAAKEVQGSEDKLKAFGQTLDFAAGIAGKFTTGVLAGLGDGFVRLTKGITGADFSLQGLNTSLSRLDKFVESGNVADYLAVAFAGTEEEKRAAIAAVIRKTDASRAGQGNTRGSFSGQGNQVDEVPEPVSVTNAPKKKKKRTGGRREPGAEFTTLDEENAFRGDFGTQEEADRLRQFEQDKADAAKRGLELRKDQAEEERKILERLTKEREKATEEEIKLAKQAADERRKAAMDTADAVGSGIQTLSNSFVKGEGAKAVISGAIESARAIAAYAAGNIPGGIGHTAAAAAFFKVAADAGAGGSKAAGSSAGSAGTSAAAASRERESVALIGERERSSDAFRRTGSYALNIYTAFPPTPEHARQLADAIDNESRNR